MTPLSCLAPGADASIGALVGYVDCQAQGLGAVGFQALAARGSSTALALDGLLVIFVALVGYRMLLGEVPSLRQAVLWMARIGLVLTLTSAWPVFSVLVYRVTMQAPSQLAAEIGRPAALPGAGGDLVERLQAASDHLARLCAQDLAAASPVSSQRGQESERAGGAQDVKPGEDRQAPTASAAASASFDPAILALPASRFVFTVSSLAALLSVRIIAGLLLALAPLFVAFLLFDATRGLFEGWVRGLGGAALGSLATMITLGLELSVIEPMVARLLETQGRAGAMSGAAEGLLVVVTLFAAVLMAALTVCGRIAAGFRMPWPSWAGAPSGARDPAREREGRQDVPSRAPTVSTEPPSRAAVIAGALVASDRREADASTTSGAGSRRAGSIGAERPQGMVAAPLGQSHRRPTRQRTSASAGRRDVTV